MGESKEVILETIGEISQKIRTLNSSYAKMIEKSEHIGLDNNEILVLSVLIRSKNNPLNMKQISEFTNLHPSILSGVLKELEFNKKYVERWRDESDLRAVNVKLTKEGMEAIEGFKSLTEEIMLKIIDQFSEEETEIILKAAHLFNEKTNKVLQEILEK